jgi:hypothetical protein
MHGIHKWLEMCVFIPLSVGVLVGFSNACFMCDGSLAVDELEKILNDKDTVLDATSGTASKPQDGDRPSIDGPAYPTITDFCEGQATTDNLPKGQTSGYTYTLDGASWTPNVNGNDGLNSLRPGSHTLIAKILIGSVYQTCPSVDYQVFAMPKGTITVT